MSKFLLPLLQSGKLDKGTLASLPLPANILEHWNGVLNGVGGLGVPREVAFPETMFPIDVTMRGETIISLESEDELRALRAVLSGQWREMGADSEEAAVATELIDAGVLVPTTPRPLDWSYAPAIYRLQHASLLFASESARIITDPVWCWSYGGGLEYDEVPAVDAVLISHSHLDHFSLLSLMAFPPDTMIVVPKVSAPSMLCQDMATLLRSAGFTNIVDAEWGSTIEIKDIRVEVCPFYGEQPWVDIQAPDPALRNWGNTYCVDIDGFSTWILIDAGEELGRSMTDACGPLLEKVGHVDLVMSNLREFPWHPLQIDGVGRYLFCFPGERILAPDSWPWKRLLTLGPEGVARVAEACGARYFLPYAHWWHTPGSGAHLIDEDNLENDMVDRIAKFQTPLAKQRSPLELGHWQVGDVATWDRDKNLRTIAFAEGLGGTL